MRFFVYIGAVLGVFCLVGVFVSNGAPQEAALAGMACAFCVIPYVLFRVGQAERQAEQHRQLLNAIRDLAGEK